MHLTYASEVRDLTQLNSSFDHGIMRVAYTGKNRNGSFISKDAYERSIQTIYNCPIVCNYNRDTDSIGAHDVDVVRDEYGGIRLVNITQPVGVVPESANTFWEYVTEDDGSVHEYLCVDVLLWKRQEAYRKIKESGVTSESMEITVKSGGKDMASGLYMIDDFEFTAFCILGDGFEPCFESASVEVFDEHKDAFALFKLDMECMMSELRESFSLLNLGEVQNNNKTTTDYSTEGGIALEEKMNLIAEYGLSVNKLNFAIDDLSVEELREKFEAMRTSGNEIVSEECENQTEENFELEGNFRDQLYSAIHSVTVETDFGMMCRYWFFDYDPAAMEVYCYDCEDGKLYGFPYAMNGDNVEIAWEKKKRMKCAVVEFDEGEQINPMFEMFAAASDKYKEDSAAWEEKFSNMAAELDSTRVDAEEYASLKEFKKNAELSAATAERNSVIEMFSDLNGNEAFEEVVANAMDLSVAELEEKCYAIRGRAMAQPKFSLDNKPTRLVIQKEEVNEEPYGGLFVEYGQSGK